MPGLWQGMLLDVEGPTKPVEVLNKVCHKMPIDIILGEYFDLMCVSQILEFWYDIKIISSSPEHVHRALVDPNSGRRFSSFKKMENVGHLVSRIDFYYTSLQFAWLCLRKIPQQRPTELAHYIFELLCVSPSNSTSPSRLWDLPVIYEIIFPDYHLAYLPCLLRYRASDFMCSCSHFW